MSSIIRKAGFGGCRGSVADLHHGKGTLRLPGGSSDLAREAAEAAGASCRKRVLSDAKAAVEQSRTDFDKFEKEFEKV